MFASSIAVVGRHSVLHPDISEVPETALGATYTADFGYPEAKWVCERLVQIADHLYGADGQRLIQGSSVRIGQMTGAEGVGAWNESEHFPIIIRASKVLGALPAMVGVSVFKCSVLALVSDILQSLSWMPVNRAGNVIVELALSKRFRPMYHMENPSRQSWSGIMESFSSILGLPIIPFGEWMAGVRALGDKTPASKLFNFLEQDFVRMATGNVILGTAEAKRDSKQMVTSTSLDKGHLEEYLAYWDSVV